MSHEIPLSILQKGEGNLSCVASIASSSCPYQKTPLFISEEGSWASDTRDVIVSQ